MIAQSPPLKDRRQLQHRVHLGSLLVSLERSDNAEFLALARRLREAESEVNSIETVAYFEWVVNTVLDTGYRGEALLGYIFSTLNRRFAARIRKRLRTAPLGARESDVEDLVMTTIEAVHRLILRSDRSRHTITFALLVSIADHRAVDFLRKKRAELSDELEGTPSDTYGVLSSRALQPDEALVRVVDHHRVRVLREVVLSAVNQLPADERKALVLVEVNGLGYPEIAEALAIKVTDVGNFVRRARKRRDRYFMAELRSTPELSGHLGFSELQENRELRVNLLRWTSEVGDGICFPCMASGGSLHTADQLCERENHRVPVRPLGIASQAEPAFAAR